MALLAVVAALVPSTTRAASAQAAPPRFATVEEAVAAGVVRAELPALLAVDPDGVDAIVGLQRAPAVAAAAEAAADGASPAEQIEEYGDALDPAREEVAGTVEVTADLPTLSVMAVVVTDADQLLALANDPDVRSVAPDAEVGSSMAEALPLVRQPEVINSGITGAGFAVALIDTGVDYGHPGFGTCSGGAGAPGCRVIVSEDVAPDDGVLDTTGHGTRTAAIAAAVAPGASLLVYDAFKPDGKASQSDLAAAVQRVILRKMTGIDIRAVNLSVAGSATSTCSGAGASTDFGLADAVAAGILPVVATGNDGSTNHVPWPACLPAALGVGAVADLNGTATCSGVATPITYDNVTCYTNSGPELDLLAPGTSITVSDLAPGSGTSFAAPFVSGAAVLLAQTRPLASPEQLRDALVNSGPMKTDVRQGRQTRRLDIAAARTRLTGAAITPWASLGGGVVGDPDVATWGGGRVDYFVRGTDNQLWHQWWDGQRLGAWEPLGGQLTSSPTAVAWGPNRLDVFARGTDGGLYQIAYDGQRWSGWIPHGGQIVDSPDVTSWAPGRLDVFVRGTDNALYQRFWNGSSWSGWVRLGGALASGPGAAAWSAGRLDVFARGIDNQLWHLGYGGAWGIWEPLGGTLAGAPDVASYAAGRLDVFVQAGDSRVWQRTYEAGWRQWAQVDEAVVGSGPGASDRGRGLLDLVVRGADGTLWYRFANGPTW